MNYFDNPWPHITIDDIIDKELFPYIQKEIVNYCISKQPTKQLSIFDNINTIDYPELPITTSYLDTVDLIPLLSYFPDHRQHTTATYRHQIIICIDGAEYRIHDEQDKKVLSAVTYIAPNISTGTLLYNSNKDFVKQVSWKENRCMVFAGITGKTWHNYKTNPQTVRITLNTFLIR